MTPLQRAQLEYRTLALTGARLRTELAEVEAAALSARNRVFALEAEHRADTSRTEWIDRVFGTIARARHHVFQILTKRPERMASYMMSVDPARWTSYLSITDGYGPSCGLEFHHAARAGYRTGEAPDHVKCPLLGEPCWHDGTSLYASEHVWPMVEPMLRSGDHEAVFRTLEYEYNLHFERYAAEVA